MSKAKTYLIPSLRVILGLLLLVAGWQKIGQPEDFARSLNNYQLLPSHLVSLSALFIPWLEVLVGSCLVVGWWSRAAALISSGLSLGFALFVTSALRRGLDVDCGCFSVDSSVSWWHVALDLAMLMVSVLIVLQGGGEASLDSRLSTEKDGSDRPLPRLVAGLGAALMIFNIGLLARSGLPQFELTPVSEAVQGPPDVVFEPPVVELGLVKQETPTEVTAVYKNVGTGKAVFSGVDSTCGCTNARLEKLELLPGESAKLTVTYSAGPNVGPVAQTVRLYVEGNPQPVLLAVQGEVDPMVKTVPGLLQLKPGEVKTVKLQSRRKGFTPKVTGASSALTMLQWKSAGISPEGYPQVAISVTAPIPQPPGKASVWPVHFQLEGAPPCSVFLKP